MHLPTRLPPINHFPRWDVAPLGCCPIDLSPRWDVKKFPHWDVNKLVRWDVNNFPRWDVKKLVCSLLTLLAVGMFSPPLAFAETLVSPNYIIRMGNFNITSGFKSSASYNLTDTVGQTVANFFNGTGYHVKAGFQYIYTLYDFSFRISSLAINLGTQTPDTFSTASHTLTVSAPGQGYQVTAHAIDQLKRQGGSDAIDDTACDSGPCTQTSAEIWLTPTNNGFGYNLTGNDIASDFTDSTYFRPFPNLQVSDPPAVVMETIQAGKNRVATVTYKLSVSPTQAGGSYATQIVYIATPVY